MNFERFQPSDPLPLDGSALAVWSVPVDVSAAHSEALKGYLTEDERQRADSFQFDAPRRRFVVGRAVLRLLLGRYLDVEPRDVLIAAAAGGKPRLVEQGGDGALHFNVAHSGDLALIAIARGCEVGVDVELLRTVERAEQIADRFFHPQEIAAIRSAARDLRNREFLRCWTAKEAVLKLVGSGVAVPLAEFAVPTIADEWAPVALPQIETPAVSTTAQTCWVRELAPRDGYVAAVACAEERRALRCFAFELGTANV